MRWDSEADREPAGFERARRETVRYHEELYASATLGQAGTWLAKPHRLLADALKLVPSAKPVVALWDLDGKRLNDLYLRTSDDLTFLGICGGAGRYQVTIADHHERFAQLANTQDPSKAEESIMCGGQLTPFPCRYLVDFDTALSAAVHYLSAGEANPALTWEWYS